MSANAPDNPIAQRLVNFISPHLEASKARPIIIGLAGAQGSGKSTATAGLVKLLTERGYKAAAVSLDDFYLGRTERRRLAAAVHPLFLTRGPPGAHDIAEAIDFVLSTREGRPATPPRFDKSTDDRAPVGAATWALGIIDIIIFEGWCVGAKPQSDAALESPINALERIFDAEGCWRREVNRRLASDYQPLFQLMDRIIYLKPPGFEIVPFWRRQQESALARSVGANWRAGVMRHDEIDFFVQHFERITRDMIERLPETADLTLVLDERRTIIKEIIPAGE